MDDSLKSSNADSSINSKETNISLSVSSDNQNTINIINQDLNKTIIKSITSNLQEILIIIYYGKKIEIFFLIQYPI